MTRLPIPGFLLAALLCCGPLAHAAAGPVVPLLIGDTLDEQGKPRPMPAARRKVLDTVAQELGITFEPRTYPWARAERYALDGVALIYGLPKTAERLRALHYSDTASHNSLWLVTRSDATFPYSRLEDLRGKTVGTVRGYSYGEDGIIDRINAALARIHKREEDARRLRPPN